MVSLLRNRTVAVLVTFHLVLFVTSPACAAQIPSMGSTTPQAGNALPNDIASVQQALETRVVRAQLEAYGLSPDEVTSKLSSLSPRQIHLLAVASPDLPTGGDARTLVMIVVIIITVIAAYSFLGFIMESTQN
ncbi:MAG: PA2779 family protein [Deltaproteobacteria bacterium]|nr:PA2779 family protein [Deltaproteobacteria bacterium]